MENLPKNTKTPLKNYLEEVIEKEKRKRNHKILMLVLFGLTAGGAIALFNMKLNISDMKIISQTNKGRPNNYVIDSIEAEQAARYSQQMPEEDYTRSIDSSEGFDDISDLFIATPPEQELADLTESKNKQSQEKRTTNLIPEIYFNVKGQQMEGEKLTFSIKGYDPKVVYTMYFGDGKQKRIGRQSVFTYEKAGVFRPTLVASNSRGDLRRTSRTIVIERKQKMEPEVRDLLTSRDSAPVATPLPKEKTESRNVASLDSSTREESMGDFNDDKQPDIPEAPKTDENAPITRPLKFAEEMPSFPGGTAVMYRYLNKKLNYPTLAYDNQIEGNVYVQFIVQPDGSLSQYHILKGIGYGCDEEVIRVVKQMPKWNPGKHNGKIVPVVYTLKVNFKFK